jgi:hypothetical protein
VPPACRLSSCLPASRLPYTLMDTAPVLGCKLCSRGTNLKKCSRPLSDEDIAKKRKQCTPCRIINQKSVAHLHERARLAKSGNIPPAPKQHAKKETKPASNPQLPSPVPDPEAAQPDRDDCPDSASVILWESDGEECKGGNHQDKRRKVCQYPFIFRILSG